jgi:hypothetical protein
MKSSILSVLRRSALTLLFLSILTSAGTAFAASAKSSAASMQAQTTTTSTATSVNWSGYAVAGHTYNKVQGDITVPTVSCTTKGAESLFWVGFDGYNDSTVEQDGVGALCSNAAKPTPTYFAWWEMFNAYTGTSLHQISSSTLSVKPGNRVASLVTYNPSTKGYLLQLDNTSTKQKAFATTQHCAAGYTCSRQTAEWIAERDELGNGSYTALAKWNYNASLFAYSEAYTSTSTKLEPISFYSLISINMISAHTNWHYLDNVKSLTGSGTTFGVSWVAAN